jgi:hypothetical protein
MSEYSKSQSHSPHLHEARSAITSKAWYGLDHATGSFNWKTSLINISSALNLPVPAVEDAITSAFTPAALTRVVVGEGEKRREEPLIKLLRDEGIEVFLWTVGDQEWQRTKYERTGCSEYVDDYHYRCCDLNKQSALSVLLDELVSRNAEKSHRVIVVDDKEANLQEAMELAAAYRSKGVELENFHMKLKDQHADPTAFYQWLQNQRSLISPGGLLSVVLDFDGVTADTDSVLFGAASENIARLLDK